MTIHHDWDKAEAAQLATLTGSKMAWFLGQARDSGMKPMPRRKRLFDVTLALMLMIPLSVVMAVMAFLLLIVQGRPIFYTAHRMRAPGQSFTQLKFRTMTTEEDDFGATGAHKHWRITPLGHFLRRTRIDELPQLFNILRGDMSFVGPRPPLREYVERFPELYAEVLQSRPGVTGLASLVYHRHEEALLARCATPQETDAVYVRNCIPRKARLDLIYRRHQNVCFDFDLVFQTIGTLVARSGRR